MPLPLKPAPEVVTCEIVRFALPLLLMAIDCVPLLPTVTLPKLAVVGLAVSWLSVVLWEPGCTATAPQPAHRRITIEVAKSAMLR